MLPCVSWNVIVIIVGVHYQLLCFEVEKLK
jgi:hypothetical protein